MTTHRRISSDGPWEPVIGYCRAVVIGNYVHVAGSTATVGGVVQHAGDAYEQTRTTLGVIERALGEAGLSLANVVRTRVYVTSTEHIDDVSRAHREAFGEILPVCTLLAGLTFVHPDMLVEVEVDAYSSTLST